MQAAKNAMESVKEKAANVGASAVAGMEKTKATVNEKVEKVAAQHPAEKQMAENKKEVRIQEAEATKQAAMEHNAAVREHARSAHNQPSQGPAGIRHGRPIGGHEEEGVAHAHPAGLQSGTARAGVTYNPWAGSDFPEEHDNPRRSF
ncbi:hypothetical protein LUZ62_028328 [Rhynchospora pubera]|uniref:Uncharacterized protein n=1 Tax=Rhynchospora pubera TaxID=906938 RepID=A0AAV8DAM6_9POAL|nr:hypothetical protein LUZ62_073658 [Rhynchospora pubera]KAJ4815762.1 hypothetical protein LUZ62_028328 [Rhynchospora pubera]